LLSLALEIIMLSVLISNSLRLLGHEQQLYLNNLQASYEQVFSVGLGAPLFNRDRASLQDALQQIYTTSLRDSDLVFVRIMTDDEQQFASVGYPDVVQQSHRLLNGFELFNFERDLIVVESEILAGVIPVGYAEYGISIHSLNQVRKQSLLQSLLIASVEVLLSILVLWFLGRYLIRHFNELQRATEEISRGRYPRELPIASQDEVGDLARSMKLMATKISSQQQQLKDHSEELSAIANYSYSCELWFDPNFTLEWVNPAVKRVLGYEPETLFNSDNFLLSLTHKDDHEKIMGCLNLALELEQSRCEAFKIRHADGHYFWVELVCKSAYAEDGRSLGVRASIIDVDEQLKTQEQLGESMRMLEKSHKVQQNLLQNAQSEQARLRSLLTSMSIGILFENTQREVDYYNPAFIRIWNINEDKMHIGIKTNDILRYSNNVLSLPDHASKRILNLQLSKEPSETFEILTTDGRTINQLSYPVTDDEGRYIGQIWMYEDITRQKQTAEQLLYMAERDHLTGLFNRRRFQEELERMIASHTRSQSRFAMIFFDLDEFKYINDTFGHRAGDTVLVRISGEIHSHVRANEFFSRLGGDEFAILAPITELQEAEPIAERIVRSIAGLPFRFEGKNLRMTTSVGVSVFPDHGNTGEAIAAHADTAMYAAKQRGKNTARIYDASMASESDMSSHLTWNERIINALDHDQFVLHYQAVKNIHSDSISHYELLIRMIDTDNPDHLIMPGNFIPVAEKTNKIVLIDQWVIRKAIAELSRAPELPALAINISGRSLDEPMLPGFIAKELETQSVDARRLILELTETSAVSDISDAQRFIEEMHKLGCQVYLDDFGAGYSTFSYLKHIHADCLKFDGQFIVDLSNDPTNQIFVRSMVSIARGLGKHTVAEFVEDADTLAMLRDMGVDMAQGYFIHKPSATPL